MKKDTTFFSSFRADCKTAFSITDHKDVWELVDSQSKCYTSISLFTCTCTLWMYLCLCTLCKNMYMYKIVINLIFDLWACYILVIHVWWCSTGESKDTSLSKNYSPISPVHLYMYIRFLQHLGLCPTLKKTLMKIGGSIIHVLEPLL